MAEARHGCANKKKARQSSKKSGYYERQRLRTARNKARRADKRKRKAAHWAKVKADAAKARDAVGTVVVTA